MFDKIFIFMFDFFIAFKHKICSAELDTKIKAITAAYFLMNNKKSSCFKLELHSFLQKQVEISLFQSRTKP